MNEIWANRLVAARRSGVKEVLAGRVAGGEITAEKYAEITGEEYEE